MSSPLSTKQPTLSRACARIARGRIKVAIRDVALMIAEAMEFTGNVVFDTSKADGQFKKTACNDKLKALRPEFEFTPMKVGIQKAVTWFVENYDTARK